MSLTPELVDWDGVIDADADGVVAVELPGADVVGAGTAELPDPDETVPPPCTSIGVAVT